MRYQRRLKGFELQPLGKENLDIFTQRHADVAISIAVGVIDSQSHQVYIHFVATVDADTERAKV